MLFEKVPPMNSMLPAGFINVMSPWGEFKTLLINVTAE